MKRGIIIFLRYPELGKVKTRLAATTGDELALEIYQELTQITLKATSNVDAQCYLFYYPHLPAKTDSKTSRFHFFLQKGEDLGAKMSNAFATVFDYCDQAIIIGTDCPYLDAPLLEEAFGQLQQADIVMGPALDGGYYLLGLNQATPQLFENISWSTDQVSKQTEDIAKQSNLTLIKLRALSDIDHEKDWEEYQAYRTRGTNIS